jgi:hypothetical protein
MNREHLTDKKNRGDEVYTPSHNTPPTVAHTHCTEGLFDLEFARDPTFLRCHCNGFSAVLLSGASQRYLPMATWGSTVRLTMAILASGAPRSPAM